MVRQKSDSERLLGGLGSQPTVQNDTSGFCRHLSSPAVSILQMYRPDDRLFCSSRSHFLATCPPPTRPSIHPSTHTHFHDSRQHTNRWYQTWKEFTIGGRNLISHTFTKERLAAENATAEFSPLSTLSSTGDAWVVLPYCACSATPWVMAPRDSLVHTWWMWKSMNVKDHVASCLDSCLPAATPSTHFHDIVAFFFLYKDKSPKLGETWEKKDK